MLDDLDCALPNTSKDDGDNGAGTGSSGDGGADAIVEVLESLMMQHAEATQVSRKRY